MAPVSLGTLFDDTSTDTPMITRLRAAADSSSPSGWRDWPVCAVSFGDTVDSQRPRQVRYALATLVIVRAFDPEAAGLSERQYKDMKLQMLHWPFCGGLMLSPSDMAASVRSSSLRHELVVQATAAMKPLFLSRVDAHEILSGVPAMVARVPPSVAESGESPLAALRHPPVPSAPSDATRVDLLEERTRCMEKSNARRDTIDNAPRFYPAVSVTATRYPRGGRAAPRDLLPSG